MQFCSPLLYLCSRCIMDFQYQRAKALIRVQDLITIHYYELEADYRFIGETHPFWEMVYVDDGAIHACNGEESFEAKAGDLLFHAPNTFHLAEGNQKDAGHIFIISFTTRSPAMQKFRDQKISLPHSLRTLISGIIHEAGATYDMENDGLYPLPDAPLGGPQLIRIYLEQLLIHLLRHQEEATASSPPAEDLPAQMILYLNSKVYDRLSVSRLCDALHYGKTHLSAAFRAATGCSIMEYYLGLKIKEAKHLLRSSDYTVAQIAALLCFDTPQYFSKVFKSQTGLSPAAWRNSLQNT